MALPSLLGCGFLGCPGLQRPPGMKEGRDRSFLAVGTEAMPVKAHFVHMQGLLGDGCTSLPAAS